MREHGKRYRAAATAIEHRKFYSPREAVEKVKTAATAKFDESVDIAVRLGVDPKHADQIVRGTVSLPHGTGKTVRVLAITSGDKAKEATPVPDAADSDTPRVEISAPFSSNGDPIPGVSSGQSVSQIAFKLEKDGDVPDDLIKLDDGYAIIQLKEKSAATKTQFEGERDTFVSAMLAAKQADALNGYVAKLRESARSEIKLNEAYSKPPEKEKQSEGEED